MTWLCFSLCLLFYSAQTESVHVNLLFFCHFPSCAQVQNAIVIPDLVDVERFKSALAQTLSAFPDLAGRLRHDSITSATSVRILNPHSTLYTHV